MPVLATPGAAVSGPAAATAASSPALPAAAPAASATRTADPVDVVSLSPAALMRQALDAPVLSMRLLDGLLQDFDQVAGLARAATPRALGTLAGDIGGAARDLGAGVQPLLTGDAVPTPLQLGAAAALRVLASLAPAGTAPPDARTPGEQPADGRAPDAGPPAAVPAGAVPTGAASTGAVPMGAVPMGAVPAGAVSTGAVSTGAGRAAPGATPPAAAARPAARAAPASLPQDVPAQPSQAARLASAQHGQARPGPMPAPPRPGADPVRLDPARQDPAHLAREAVIALLGEAAVTLGRMRFYPRDTSAVLSADAARDEAWCEAQIAAALGSVAQVWRMVAGTRPAAAAGRSALFAARADTPEGAARALRLGAGAALLCWLCAALWATQALDLGVARALTAAALGVAAVAWAWRRAGWRRVRVEVRH